MYSDTKSVVRNLTIKATLAVNFVFFFSSPKLMYMKIKQYEHVLGVFFIWNAINICSTFTINIESSLVHPMNIFICLQANIY